MISAVVMNVVQSSILMTIVQLLSIVRMAIWILRIIVLRIGTWKESIAIILTFDIVALGFVSL